MSRAHGDGSVWFDEDRDRWRGQLDLGRGPDGRRKYRRVSGLTKTEASAKLRELRSELDTSGAVAPGDVSFGDLMRAWLDSRAGNVSPLTVDNYRDMAEHHLLPALGSTPAGKVTPEMIEKVLQHLAAKNYARSTLVRIRNVTSQAYKWGIRRRSATWNPAAVAEIPAVTKPVRRGRALNVDEFRDLIEAAQKDRLGALVIVAVTAGLRPSETTALSWSDLDLGVGTARIWRAWKGSGSNRELGDTKTEGSRRSLKLADVAVDALQQHRLAQVEERLAFDWPDEHRDLVFVSEVGTPIDPSNLRKIVKRIASDAAIEGTVTPYTFRHTAASLLSDAGVSNEALADAFGHRTTRMLERHYRHRVRDVIDVVAAPMDDLVAVEK